MHHRLSYLSPGMLLTYTSALARSCACPVLFLYFFTHVIIDHTHLRYRPSFIMSLDGEELLCLCVEESYYTAILPLRRGELYFDIMPLRGGAIIPPRGGERLRRYYASRLRRAIHRYYASTWRRAITALLCLWVEESYYVLPPSHMLF